MDLLSPAYFQQVELLQDRVPPFPCEDARREMEKVYGGRRGLNCATSRVRRNHEHGLDTLQRLEADCEVPTKLETMVEAAVLVERAALVRIEAKG